MLVHSALDRAAQVARLWADAGSPVVIHVDARVGRAAYQGLVDALQDAPQVRFCRRYRCEWGTWSLVAAMQAAGDEMLRAFPEVTHI
ncbi:MAG TPA: glycosyl transferase, partial [Paracoccus sp.]|nr:glycosyl transferase [Paracoccus sp. (in: a-proteobacteria)]